MILIPVKNLQNAKQRLAHVLDQRSRTALAQAMVHDVLEAVSACSPASEVAVVTNDPFASRLAGDLNFRVIRDNNISETDAIEMATSLSHSQGAENTLVIPGDIPLIKSEELEQILTAAPRQGSLLVPAADGRGTNAAFRSPANLFPLRFGNDSFQPHLKSAHETGLPFVILQLPGIALDIDNPSDLQRLVKAPGETRAQRLAREWDLTSHPLAANE
jgi:2-phospho-L-lactate guanylyltransferase